MVFQGQQQHVGIRVRVQNHMLRHRVLAQNLALRQFGRELAVPSVCQQCVQVFGRDALTGKYLQEPGLCLRQQDQIGVFGLVLRC